jgi:hypothetical protein
MSDHWDEFSKSLAEKSVPRRQTLRLLGAALAGAILGPLGAGTAWAGKRGAPDPCTARCKCGYKPWKDACLASCRSCLTSGGNFCGGGCRQFACCAAQEACCGDGICKDLADDFDHCGECWNACADPGPFENGACVDGTCQFWCYEDAVLCDGECSLLDRDRYNCGACGIVCPDETPVCSGGTCIGCPGEQTNCGGECVYLGSDRDHCGACFAACPGGSNCYDGVCE